jgi:hypothetical protein
MKEKILHIAQESKDSENEVSTMKNRDPIKTKIGKQKMKNSKLKFQGPAEESKDNFICCYQNMHMRVRSIFTCPDHLKLS